MKEYIDEVHSEIEKKRNELRVKYYQSNDPKIKEELDKYEDAYIESCMKIDKMIEYNIKNKNLDD